MNDLCTEIRFVWDDHTAPASINSCHTSRWLTDVAASPVRLRYFCNATIACGGGPPLCEFGRWGPAAEYWAVGHVWTGQPGRCTDCGVWQSQCCEPEEWCHSGDGGIYGMCGYRPLNAEELAAVSIGARYGPWSVCRELRDGPVCQLLGRHDFDDANQCKRCGVIRQMLRVES